MLNLIYKVMPNLMRRFDEFIDSTVQTLLMTFISGAISFVFGIVFAVILVVTQEGGIKPNRALWMTLDKITNLFRSIPFIILIALLIPVTRIIMHTGIGIKGAMIPLVAGCVPFFTRQMESALAEIDHGAIEAALSMGTGTWGIIFRVYLKESIPGIIRGVTITLINLIGLTAMAGAIGGGGLGDFAIRYGYQRYQTDITIATVVLLVLLVSLIQWIGSTLAAKTSH